MADGPIIQAAKWLASFTLAQEPTVADMQARYKLDAAQCGEAKRAAFDIRDRVAVEQNAPRYHGCLTGRSYG